MNTKYWIDQANRVPVIFDKEQAEEKAFGQKFIEVSDDSTLATVVAEKGDHNTIKTRYLLKNGIFENSRFRLDVQCESSGSFAMIGVADKNENLFTHPYSRQNSYYMSFSGG